MAISRASILTGHVLGSMIQTMLGVGLVIGVSVLMGFRPTAGPVRWIAAITVLALLTLALTWLAVALGLVTKTPEAASNVVMPLFLLPFISSAFVPWPPCPAGSAGSLSTSLHADHRHAEGTADGCTDRQQRRHRPRLVCRHRLGRVPLGADGVQPRPGALTPYPKKCTLDEYGGCSRHQVSQASQRRWTVLTIGQLAAYVGVTVRAVRHYHQRGLLAEPARDSSGYRRYDADAVIDLIRIKTLAGAGVPLARIEELLNAEPEQFSEAITGIDEALTARSATSRTTDALLPSSRAARASSCRPSSSTISTSSEPSESARAPYSSNVTAGSCSSRAHRAKPRYCSDRRVRICRTRNSGPSTSPTTSHSTGPRPIPGWKISPLPWCPTSNTAQRRRVRSSRPRSPNRTRQPSPASCCPQTSATPPLHGTD